MVFWPCSERRGLTPPKNSTATLSNFDAKPTIFPQLRARPAAVLGDDLDAGRFEGVEDFGGIADRVGGAGARL